MKKLIPLLIISIACSVTATLSATHKKENTMITNQDLSTFTAQQDLAFAIGLQAYLYALPLYMMEYTMQTLTTHPGDEANAPLGTFGHAPRLLTPKDNFIVTPNNDTLYSSAWLDLAKEPYVLHIPEFKDRYYSFTLYDAWTNVFKVLSVRTRGAKPGTYVIAGPTWKGKTPEDLETMSAPTNLIWILVRILVAGESDIPTVKTLQKKFGLTPLSVYEKTGTFKVVPAQTGKRYTEHTEISFRPAVL